MHYEMRELFDKQVSAQKESFKKILRFTHAPTRSTKKLVYEEMKVRREKKQSALKILLMEGRKVVSWI